MIQEVGGSRNGGSVTASREGGSVPIRLAASANKLARWAYWKAKSARSGILDRRTILVMRKKIALAHRRDEFRIAEYSDDAKEIINVYKSVARYNCYLGSDDDARMAARVRRGMKFYGAFEDDKVIAYLWLHSDSHRFFDEIGTFVKHGANDLWLRDAYVVPEKRGQRTFSNVINAVIRNYYADASHLYSDVMQDNEPSLKAHKYLGLNGVGHVRFTRILGRVLVREVNVEGLETYGYKNGQDVVITNHEFTSYTNANRC